jgi:GT2 family glycosyltransferase
MNGFDERFFAHQEEIDLCWRLKNAGRKIYYCGKSTVFHVGGGTLNKQSLQKTYLNIRNNLSMLLKNLPLVTLFG